MGKFTTAVAKYLWQVLINLHEATKRWRDDDAGLLAAGVAFYATISMVPLLLVLIAGCGLFLRYTSLGLDAELNVVLAIEERTSSEVADSVSVALGQVQEQAVVGGPLGMIGLVVAAIAVFARFDRALEMIWKTERRKTSNLWATALNLTLHRVKAFATLLGLGLVVLTIFATGMAFSAISKFGETRFPIWDWISHIAEMGLSITLNACVFGLIYRLLGRAKIDWRSAMRGGLLAAVTWEAGRLVLAEFLIDDRYTAYGMVGSLLVLMLWAYYATSVLLLGAEYVQVIREGEPAGLGIEPQDAVRDVGATEIDVPESIRFRQVDHGFRRWRSTRRNSEAA